MNTISRTNRAFAAKALAGTTIAFFGSTAQGQLTITPTFGSSITSLSNAGAIETSIDAAIANITSSVTTRYPDAVTIDFRV
jgi:hypothetical protein